MLYNRQPLLTVNFRATTYLRCGENYYTGFIGNLTTFQAVKEFCKLLRRDNVTTGYHIAAAVSQRTVNNYAMNITDNSVHAEEEVNSMPCNTMNCMVTLHDASKITGLPDIVIVIDKGNEFDLTQLCIKRKSSCTNPYARLSGAV